MKLARTLLSLEAVSVTIIVAAAAFLRLYRISDYLTFLGDEGRDALVVRGILQGHLTLLGPRASAGDFFLGPIYYYFMAPFLWLWNFDPVGPAIMIALLGTITVWLVYYVGKDLFGTLGGVIAAALYALSPIVIAYSRSSWNPNPMPFFSLLILYLAYKAVIGTSKRLLFLVGLLYGITLQLHYLAVFLGVILVCFLVIARVFQGKQQAFQKLFSDIAKMLLGFVVGFSPFIAFELRHGFSNVKAIFSFIFNNSFEASYRGSESFFGVIFDVFFRLFGRLMTRFPPPEQVSIQSDANIALWYFATLCIAFVSSIVFFWQGYIFYKVKNEKKVIAYLLIGLWLLLGVVLFGFYKKQIYDYYFGFMFPVPFLLVGNLFGSLIKSKKLFHIGGVFGAACVAFLLYWNYLGAPFFSAPNRQKEQVKRIADFVLSKTDNKPFNFALLTNGNSDHGYRYFFELAGKSPVTIENEVIDPNRKSVTDQLLIVCEDPNCKPLGNSLWEVAGFGRAEIVDMWTVSVVKVYKLNHYSPQGTKK